MVMMMMMMMLVVFNCCQKNLWKYGDFREDEDKEFGYRP